MADWLMFLGAAIVIAVILGIRSANQSYTIGSGLFKNSDYNLDKDKHVDPADYDYYNKKGKLK